MTIRPRVVRAVRAARAHLRDVAAAEHAHRRAEADLASRDLVSATDVLDAHLAAAPDKLAGATSVSQVIRVIAAVDLERRVVAEAATSADQAADRSRQAADQLRTRERARAAHRRPGGRAPAGGPDRGGVPRRAGRQRRAGGAPEGAVTRLVGLGAAADATELARAPGPRSEPARERSFRQDLGQASAAGPRDAAARRDAAAQREARREEDARREAQRDDRDATAGATAPRTVAVATPASPRQRPDAAADVPRGPGDQAARGDDAPHGGPPPRRRDGGAHEPGTTRRGRTAGRRHRRRAITRAWP